MSACMQELVGGAELLKNSRVLPHRPVCVLYGSLEDLGQYLWIGCVVLCCLLLSLLGLRLGWMVVPLLAIYEMSG
eukprot:12900105-Prorocentrum_lima.AAC.1